MKRKSTILRMLALLALLVPWTLQAQNAKVSEYDGAAATATYTSIAGTNTAQTLSGGYADVSMPFSMYFGETQVPQGSTLRVWNDGSVTFNGIAALANARIAPLYYSSRYTTSTVYASGSGQQLTIEWRKAISGQNSYSFQLKLYLNGDIEFCYGPMTISSSIDVLVGMMSSDEDIYRVGGANGGSAWDTITRYTSGLTTRTLSSTYAPYFNTANNQGVVYTFTQPLCVKPTNVTATALAWNTIQVDWELSSPGSSFEVKYSADPTFDPDNGGASKTVSNGSATSTTITTEYGSTIYYIYVRKICSGTPSGWSQVATATTLPGCYNAYMPSVTPNGVVSWTSPNEMVTSYNLKYGLAGFNPDEAGTAVNNITALSYTLPVSQLQGATTYDVYISTNCASSGASTDWVGPVSFNTPCAAIALAANDQYLQDFSGSALPTCWNEEVISGGSNWSFNSGYCDFPYNPGNSSRLLTPTFALDPTGSYNLEFYHYEQDYSGVCDSLIVYYRTTASGEWVRLAAYGNHGSDWVKESLALPTPTATYQLSFVGIGMDGYNVYLDEVKICPPPTCPAPSALAEVSHTGNSVTLSWTENGSATAWQIAYGMFTTDDDYTIVNATSNPFTVTGLTAEQTYQFFVRSYCASDDQSEWIGPVSATPSNLATLTVNDGTTTNEYVPVYGYYVDSYSRSQLIIPASELTAMQWGTVSKLTFYSSNTSVNWGSAQFDVYMTEVGNTTISSLVDWNSMESLYHGSLSISDGKMEITLTTPYLYTGGNLLIGINSPVSGSYVRAYFYGVTASGASMGGYGSSVSQRNFLPKTTFNYVAGEPVTCFKPNSLAVSGVTSTTANLTWNEMGASTQWEVKYGPAGFNIAEGEGISVMVNTTPSLVLDYLEPVKNYEAYVRAICNPEGPTEWSNVCEFSTLCPNSSETTVDGTVTYTMVSGTNPDLTLTSHGAIIYDDGGPSGNYSSSQNQYLTVYPSTPGAKVHLYDPSATTEGNSWDYLIVYNGVGTSGAQLGEIRGSNVTLDVTSTDATGAVTIYFRSDGSVTKTGWAIQATEIGCDMGSCVAPQAAITLSDEVYAATLAFTNMNEDVTNPTYGIVWGPQGFNPVTSGTTVAPITTSTYTLSNLAATTSYDVYVYAICGSNNGDTVRYSFTTPFIPNCKTPNTIAASDITYNTANLTWNQPGDVPQTWTVRYATADFDPATAAATDYTELTITGSTTPAAQLTGLVAGTTYYVYIKSTCSTSPVDESPWSAMSNANPAYIFSTPECVTPTNPTVSNVTNITADIAWTGDAAAYTLKYGQPGFDPDNEGTEVACTTTSAQLTGLDQYATYEVYVKANCTATDESDWSAAATFRTSCPDGGDATLGNGTYTSAYVPVHYNWGNTYCQQIFTAQELTEAGMSAGPIQGISFSWYYRSSYTKEFTIYIGTTNKDEFNDNSDWITVTGDPVYGPAEFATSAAQENFAFNTPFVWDGVSNIVITTIMNQYNGSGTGGSGITAYAYDAGYNRSLYNYRDSYAFVVNDPETSGNQHKGISNYRANITFMANCNTNVTCFAPASVSASVAENNVVTVSWTSRTDLLPVVNNFELKYGLAGFDPDRSGTLVPNLNNVFNYNITAALDANTDYEVAVRTVCGEGEGNQSKWTKAAFHTYPTCWAPSALAVTATSQNSATLSWTENTPTAATRWEVVYGLPGFDPDRATPVETTNNTGFELTGLNHTTKYEFYVRAVCSATDRSLWSNVATGTTQCGTWQYADMPLVENFDGVTGTTSSSINNHVLPNCWDYINTSTTTSGTSTTGYPGYPIAYNSASYSHSGSNHMRFYTYTTAAYGDQYAILPPFGFDLDTVVVGFYARESTTTSTYVGNIEVGVMSDPDDASTFVAVGTVQPTTTSYEYFEVDFSEYAGTDRYIALKAVKPTSGYNVVYVDDLTVKLREKVNSLDDAGETIVACNEFVMPDTTNGGYHGGLNATYVVRPAEAGKVAHLTGSYNLENGYDFLSIYRGAANANNLVGRYTGNDNIDYVTSSNQWADSGYFTLVLTTDEDNAFAGMEGFKLLVSCECPQPAADVIAETQEANGTYTWRNGTTYNNNVVRTGLTYDATAAGETAADLLKEVEYTYVNVGGCDSVSYSLNLTVHPTYSLTYDAQICERDTFLFYGQKFAATGTYTVALTSQYGADSTGILNLQVNPAPTAGIYVNNRQVTTIDAYCDNADLALLARSNNSSAVFEWEDESTAANRVVNPHESNVYTVVATEPAHGCTSVPATLTVTTVPVPELSISGDAEICYGESTTLTLADANNVEATYRWSNGATGTSITVNPTATTTYTVTATTSNTSACTATASLEVVVNALPVVAATASVGEICRDSIVTLTATEVEGYSYSWSTGAATAVATTAAATTGVYTVTVTDQNGCQNVFQTSTVTVYPSYELTDDLSVCYTNNPYTWGEQTITANGNYDQNFVIAHGCDSLVHLAFTFEEMGVENSNREVCEGTSVTWGDQTIVASETTLLTYVDNSGECPVQKNLNLVVNHPAATTIEQTVCDSYTWTVSGETYTESGVYPYTLATTKGCDSVVTLNLTVNYQNTGVETVTACDSYVWDLNGQSYTATTNEPTFTLQNQWGCDSVVTLDLTVNYRSYHEDFHCVRDAATFTWIDGETYNLNVDVEDGIEHVTGENADGCNEIAQLHLVINPVINVLNWATVEACDEYEIANAVVFDDENDCQGHIEPLYLTESGDYEIRTRANADVTGQDQLTRIHLTINRSSYHTTVATECLPYTWTITGADDQPFEVATITEADVNGAPVFNMSVDLAEAGYVASACSNIEVLRLTPKYPSVEYTDAVICQNGFWTAPNNNVYYGNNLSTEEVNVLTWDNSELNAAGCPMEKKVNLTVNPTYNETAELTFCESEFALNTETGEYELTVADANHDGAEVVLTIPGALNEVAYTNSVVANWQTALGCDSIVNIDYTVNPTTTKTDVFTVCYKENFEWDANGIFYGKAGNYVDTVLVADENTGCELYRVLNLTVLGTYEYFDTISVCTTYEGPDGVTYRETRTFDVPYEGTYDETQYCDAITHRTYKVLQNTLTEHYVLTNADYTWMNGTTYTESTDNVYYAAPVAGGDCDDVHLLHLTMVDPIAVCENALPYTVTYGNRTFTIPADAADNGTLGNGNDTIIYFTVLRNTTLAVAQTACDSYTWTDGDNATYTTSGEYVYTTTNVAGCDSTVTLTLTVNVSTAETVTVAACDSYTWADGDGETYTESGNYEWTTTNEAGCDSVVTLALTVNTNAGVELAETACATYTWDVNGTTYTTSGDYTVSFTDANGCTGDSVLHLTINPTYETNSELVVNEGSYTYLGVMYTAPFDGVIDHTFQSINGCDSIDHLHLIIPIVADDQIVEIHVEACGSYTWEAPDGTGHTYEWIPMSERISHGNAMFKDVTANQYVYTYPTDTTFDAAGAMTAVRVLNLSLLEAVYSTETINVPASLGTYTIDGDPDDVTITFNLDSVGTPIVRTLGVGSVAYCNDFRTYTINVIDNYDTTEVYACADEATYEWNGTDYTIGTPGHTYYFSQVENAGTLNELVHVLKVNQRAVNAATATATACDTYTWTDGDGLTYTTSGTYVYNYTDENQCAATKTLTLTVNYNGNTAYTDVACDTYTWARNNQTYTATGDYTYNYNTAEGCASTDTLHLTINSNSNQTFTEAACNSYVWAAAEGGDGLTYTTSGTYTYNYNADNGCPSVNTLNLTINLPTNSSETVVACDSTEWNGTMYYTSGNYEYDYTTAAGCASTDTLHLTVNTATHNSETMTQCDSYVWNGTTYTATGDYMYTYTNVAGCPSVDTLHLTINVNTSTINDTIVACDEYTWAVNNRLYNTSGEYTARTTDANGCATTNTLTLTINRSSSYDSVLYVSDGSYRYTYQDQHQELFGEGVYNLTEMYTNAAGCDSTLNVTLNVGNAQLGIDNVVNCNSYTWRNGETYVYIDAAERAANLNADNVAPLYKTSNGVYVYYNPTYTVAQDNGFDSIYMLALTLTQSYLGNDEVTLNISDRTVIYGDSVFTFNSEADMMQNFVSEDREYDVHFGAVQYCDSIITLTVHLVNNYQEVTDDAADICVSQDSYTWRNHTISTATTDYDNAHTYYIYDTLATGTIEYITVTQHPISYTTERRTACDSYEWYGTTYTESTTNATQYLPAGTVVDGETLICDRVATLILVINHNTSTTYDVASCENYIWTAANGGNGDTLTESGTYTYDYETAAGCPSTNTLNLTINHNTSTEYTVDACDSYTWTAEEGGNGTVYTTASPVEGYTYDYLTADGCPSTNTLHLTIRNNSNQTFTETACDSYTWTEGGDGLTYTASGIYTYDYEAENGCPSTNTLNLTINENSSTAFTVAACDSYTWHGTEYTVSGDYTYDYADANNCASVDTLHLTVNSSTLNVATAIECNSYTWTHTDNTVATLTASGAYEYLYTDANGCTVTDSLYLTIGNGRSFGIARVTNCGPYTWVVEGETVAVLDESVETSTTVTNPATGCDSTIFLYLTINPQNVTEVTICDNESYTWTVNNETYTEAGTYDVNENDNDGNCTSSERLVLTVNPTKATALTDQICLGNDYNNNGFVIAASELPAAGEYTFTQELSTSLGCDSIVTLTLTVGDVINNPVEAVACDTYDWTAGDGETYTYTASGTYSSEPYANAAGCTTVDVLTLTINVNAGTEYTETVCDAYMWNGTQYTESGDYTFDYTDGNGCASTDVLHLTVNKSSINTIEEVVCDSYTWENGDGQTYTASGVYTYNYTTSDGCAGTDYLVLTVNQNSSTEYTATACDSYIWNDVEYTESGDYSYEYSNAAGCPSTDVLHLTVNKNSNTEYTATACDSYNWYNTNYTESGDYTYEYINNSGCASVDVLHLTVNNSVVVTIDTTVCGYISWNNIVYEDSDVITHHFTAANGCDSTEIVNLTVNQTGFGTEFATACDSYTWHDMTFTSSVSYHDILEGAAANGCDSVVVLMLTINNGSYASEVATACDSYTWNGTDYTTSGDYVYTYTAANGCASADTLHLTVNASTTSEETVAACNYYIWNGNAYNQSGDYTYTSTNADGCQNTATLHLTINSQVTNNITATACNSYTWNGNVYTTSGVYTETYTSAGGCDSTVNLALTINTPVTSSVNATACDSYTWNGQTYTTSGAYTFNGTAANGCDSIVTLNLTVNSSAANTVSATACGSYTWNGATYTTSGNYTQTYTTVAGCDSVVTLDLTISPAIQTTINEATCNSYTWNGQTYYTSGVYSHTFTSASGCDSVVTLVLTVTPTINMTVTATACDSYTWNGNVYTTSGNYTHSYTAAAGCDSIVTLVLTVNNSTTGTATATACDSYTWNGQTYTTSGNYTYNYTAANGCDSVVTLTLTVNNSIAVSTDVTVCDSYTWNGLNYVATGAYTQSFTAANGCDSVVTLNLTVNQSYTSTDVVEECDGYIWIDGVNYTTSTTSPRFTFIAANGCDSVVNLNLTINHSVEIYDSITILETELPYNFRGNNISSAGDYVYNGTTVSGCDSTVYLHVNVQAVGIDVVNSLDDVNIYPNPTRGRVTVTADEVVKVEVLDIVGRLVATFENTNTFDISDLGEGAYTLRITLPNGTTVRKVVKK